MELHTCNPALARLRQENGESQADLWGGNQGPTEEVTEGASGKLTR